MPTTWTLLTAATMNFIVLAAVLPVAAAGNVTRCLEDNCKILTTTCHLDKNCSAGLRCVEVAAP